MSKGGEGGIEGGGKDRGSKLGEGRVTLHGRYGKYILAEGYRDSQDYAIRKGVQPKVPGIGWQCIFAVSLRRIESENLTMIYQFINTILDYLFIR